MNASTQIYCVTHEAPLVPDALFDYEIAIGEYQPRRGIHISKLDTFWHTMRPYAYGAAGNYAVLRAIDACAAKTPLTGVISHRKTVIRSSIGREAAKYPVFREITAADAAQLPRSDAQPRDGLEFLIGRPIKLPQGLFLQYAQVHRAVDLVEYLSIGLQAGVLSASEVQEFAMETYFIPGGCELGIYPTEWLCTTLRKLEMLGRYFVTRSAERLRGYDRYQVRAVGFLAERLGSFWLLRELRQRYPRGLPANLFGNLGVVVPAGGSYDAARATD